MKLYFANTSPFARKVRMTVIEKDLSEQVEPVLTNPFERNPDLLTANPLHKVPTLVTSDGIAIHDSPVICEYLDTVGEGPSLFSSGQERWKLLTHAATCGGMLDALFHIVMERRRPESEQSTMWKERWEGAFLDCVEAVSQSSKDFEGPINIAQLSLGAALGYADFRTPDIDWRNKGRSLVGWFENFSERDAMKETFPE